MNKGNYYKVKTKKWLEKDGYQVEYLEKLQRIFTGAKLFYVKKDLFASDILAMNEQDIIFVQVKSGKNTTGISIKKAIQEFQKYQFPEFVKRWIVVWRDKQKEPEVIEVEKTIKEQE